MVVLLPTTLCLVAAALVINFWLAMRCGKVRMAQKIDVGDGGNDLMIRRMRAHSNFIEQAPLILFGIALIEMAGKGGIWLAPAGAAFMIGRVCHAIGMDGNFKAGRPIGMLTGMLLSLALVVVAVLISLGKM